MTETNNKKVITVALVMSCALLALVVGLLMETMAASFSVVARAQANPELANGIPVAVGILVFLFLQFNTKTVDFLDGVVTEVKKVVWPTKKDAWLMTVVVVITLILSGVIVGLYDMFWAKVIGMIVK